MKEVKRLPTEDIIKNSRLMHDYHTVYHWTDGWAQGEKMHNFLDLMHLPELTGVPISGTSVLDVGCGTGDFSLFLRKRGMTEYLGIDIYEPSLEKARKKYPDEEFRFLDLLSDPITRKFDYAFCSGGMTTKLSINNYDFLQTMVSKMWDYATVGVAFNCLTDDDEDPDDALFFYNVKKVMRICQKIVGRGQVKTHAREDLAQSHFYLYR